MTNEKNIDTRDKSIGTRDMGLTKTTDVDVKASDAVIDMITPMSNDSANVKERDGHSQPSDGTQPDVFVEMMTAKYDTVSDAREEMTSSTTNHMSVIADATDTVIVSADTTMSCDTELTGETHVIDKQAVTDKANAMPTTSDTIKSDKVTQDDANVMPTIAIMPMTGRKPLEDDSKADDDVTETHGNQSDDGNKELPAIADAKAADHNHVASTSICDDTLAGNANNQGYGNMQPTDDDDDMRQVDDEGSETETNKAITDRRDMETDGNATKETRAATVAKPETAGTSTQPNIPSIGDGISMSNVIATALAAVTATMLSSQIGITGGIIGTAVASVVSTVATRLYANMMRRSAGMIANRIGNETMEDNGRTKGDAQTDEEAAMHRGDTLVRPAIDLDAYEPSPARDAARRRRTWGHRSSTEATQGMSVQTATKTEVTTTVTGATEAPVTGMHARLRAFITNKKAMGMTVAIAGALVALAITAGIINAATDGNGIGAKTDFTAIAPSYTVTNRNENGNRDANENGYASDRFDDRNADSNENANGNINENENDNANLNENGNTNSNENENGNTNENGNSNGNENVTDKPTKPNGTNTNNANGNGDNSSSSENGTGDNTSSGNNANTNTNANGGGSASGGNTDTGNAGSGSNTGNANGTGSNTGASSGSGTGGNGSGTSGSGNAGGDNASSSAGVGSNSGATANGADGNSAGNATSTSSTPMKSQKPSMSQASISNYGTGN